MYRMQVSYPPRRSKRSHI